MKQAVKPTAAQKRWMTREGLNPKEWSVHYWNAMEALLENKVTKEQRKLKFYD